MEFYDKKIQYLDLWEYGEKIGNAGFVKLDVRDEECRIWISIKGVYPTDVMVGQLFLLRQGEELLADQILFHQGIGTYAAKWRSSNLAQMGITYAELEGIRVKISEQRIVEKIWRRCETEESQFKEVTREKDDIETRGAMNKWSRLGQYYKKKNPFGDDKEYLCISPEDLILLPEKYEHLYKNSFLLHGYYAYGHILLGTVDLQSRNIYRLYIPGLGHDKEQIVAGMFGFGNFTPVRMPQPDNFVRERPDTIAEQFGYYYMTVEL